MVKNPPASAGDMVSSPGWRLEKYTNSSFQTLDIKCKTVMSERSHTNNVSPKLP